MAERKGFKPSLWLSVNILSKRAEKKVWGFYGKLNVKMSPNLRSKINLKYLS